MESLCACSSGEFRPLLTLMQAFFMTACGSPKIMLVGGAKSRHPSAIPQLAVKAYRLIGNREIVRMTVHLSTGSRRSECYGEGFFFDSGKRSVFRTPDGAFLDPGSH